MDAYRRLARTGSHQSIPFQPDHTLVDASQAPSRMPLLLMALLCGAGLAVLFADSEAGTFLHHRPFRRSEWPGATPVETRHSLAHHPDMQPPHPSSAELTLQTGLIRLPPLSVVKITFPKAYETTPEIKIASEITLPDEVAIEEVTQQHVIIRNAHGSSECSLRYLAEGKLQEDAGVKSTFTSASGLFK